MNHILRSIIDEELQKAYERGAIDEREECADLVLTLTCKGNAKECFELAATYILARGQA